MRGRGSIPACTGETSLVRFSTTICKVYPRVYGGNIGMANVRIIMEGLSPRVRGKHWHGECADYYGGSIPACTGETLFSPGGGSRIRVYPRVYGGNDNTRIFNFQGRGLSPRVRGKLNCWDTDDPLPRSIPACTGETAAATSIDKPNKVYPRVYGGNEVTGCVYTRYSGLSPRVRGKQAHHRYGSVS